MKSLLSHGGGPLQHFWAAPQEISYRLQNAGTVRNEMPVKLHHANKFLQLLVILGGGARVDCGGVFGCRGRTCHRNCVAKNFQSWNCKNTFVQNYGKAIGG